MEQQTQREIGVLQGTVQSIESRVGKMEEKVDKIYTIVTSNSGGWKALLSIITLTAVVTTILNNLGRFFNGP